MGLGSHVIKAWSSTQATIALSSGEAELFAMVKGAAHTLGIMSMLCDMSMVMQGRIGCDSSAAIGIASRLGLGKLRHLKVQYLWIQERIRELRAIAVAALCEGFHG